MIFWNRKKIGDKRVSVAVTPNGYADAPNKGYFVMPEERFMLFADFLNIMEEPHSQPGVDVACMFSMKILILWCYYVNEISLSYSNNIFHC